MPRTLIEETPRFRRYRVTNGQGQVTGEDVEPILAGEQLTEQSLRSKASGALAVNNTFLGLATPDAAAVRLQVQRLTRENNALIRLVLDLLDVDDA